MAKKPANPTQQQGGSNTPSQQQDQSQGTTQQQGSTPIFRDWASI
jgi:hypothetical protein